MLTKGKNMSRPFFIKSEIHPYHVTARCLGKDFFPIPLDEVWRIMLDELYQTHKCYGLCIHAFVLMGNHFHLLCHTPHGNLDQIMQQFMRNTSVRIRRKANTIIPLWGSRYKWSLIQSQAYYYQVYKYIYQNPIRAQIVSKVEDYTFSSLHEVPFPIHSFVPLSFAGKEGERIWLNESFDSESQELIKLGLKKHLFDVNKRKIKVFNRLKVPNIQPPE